MGYKFILVLFITGLLQSCNRNNRIYNEVKGLSNQKISFVDGYTELQCNSRIKLDSLLKNEIKVVTYIDDMPCSSCAVRALKSWQREIKNIDKDLAYLIIVHTDDRAFVDMADTISLDFPLMYYNSNKFGESNKLEGLLTRNKTFLLNKDNKVVLVGEPFGREKLAKLYKRCIDSLMIMDLE